MHCRQGQRDKVVLVTQSLISTLQYVDGCSLGGDCDIAMKDREHSESLQRCSRAPLVKTGMERYGCGQEWDCLFDVLTRVECEVVTVRGDLGGSVD